ncbi:carboxypeptidase M32 [Varunaivibrio sulfuroxidans]|uniref:Metal-dependent carboxypeptidase n=1 Tax=Varunaivibrio sulfuroxidans TaxID=1773489 RepID=A0A4R3JD74_9PROT|nr:carboxypeptidase M32 [Varunaivibrio sulfuroxidans]TCS62650.1 carboxypeptidase Taq [Varunaivibrio sulfuroxidans]WES30684.1 carboxypeptidase M32 [Varunaivibrio sulfuroxidans]
MQKTPYRDLEARFARLDALEGASAMLHWDMSAMMPAGGAESRAEQLAVLKTLGHAMLCAPEMADLLGAAATQSDLDPWQRANITEMRRRWVHATAIDDTLVEALSRACSACETVWRGARAENDFARVLPFMKEVLALTREVGAAKAEKLGVSVYDALLDEYEPDGRAHDIDAIFADLEAFLPDFLSDVMDVQARKPAPLPLDGPFPIDRQRGLGLSIMKSLGFDFEHGRLDVSLHPFCGGVPDDVRITTRYSEDDFASSLMGVIHETGHALYERGLPTQWSRQPVGKARGMSLHESQSLLMEMQACRSLQFLSFAAPIMRKAFDAQGPAWTADNLARLYTRVEPGFIRVDADEVTYPAHVILRYRLEKALIGGDMRLEELPGAWNEGLHALLGITPPNDRLGCLQDIHWYDGAWGYFPTYTLGAMTAAQLFDAARKAQPGLPDAIARGNFAPLLGWLRSHVHERASSASSTDIITAATGKALDADIFKNHLKARYLEAT